VKIYVDLFSALLTPLIAIVMTYIAIQQYRANQLKLRHDLYDRRLLLYNAVAEFLAHVMREGTADRAQLVTLLQKTRESYFLFGKEISDYVTDLYKKGVDLEHYEKQLDHSHLPVGGERTRIAGQQAELLKWFGHQFDVIQPMFAKKLSLE
jgi:hypothetical protein